MAFEARYHSRRTSSVHMSPREDAGTDLSTPVLHDDDDDGNDLEDQDDNEDEERDSTKLPPLPPPPPPPPAPLSPTESVLLGPALYTTSSTASDDPSIIVSTPASPFTSLSSIPTTLLTSTTSSSQTHTAVSHSRASSTDISTSRTTRTSAPSESLPAITMAPTGPAMVKSSTHEPRAAFQAGLSIAAVSVFIALLFVMFRFCPPIRNRWLERKERKNIATQKRLGLEEMSLPSPVIVAASNHPRTGHSRNSPGLRGLEDAHLRPPSYRSRYT